MGLLTDIVLGVLGVGAAVATTAAVGYGAYKLYKYITAETIKEEARKKCKNAFKARIKAKKDAGKTLFVDVYSRDNEQLGTMEMQAEEAPQNLYVGQEIYV